MLFYSYNPPHHAPAFLPNTPGTDLTAFLCVTAAGTAATLLLTAKAASAWASAQNKQAAAAAGGAPVSLCTGPAGPALLSLAALASVVPLALTRNDPLGVGAAMALPVGVAWSVFGYLSARVLMKQDGSGSWLSPTLVGALAANVGVAWHASMMGMGYLTALSGFYAGEVSGVPPVAVVELYGHAWCPDKCLSAHTVCAAMLSGRLSLPA